MTGKKKSKLFENQSRSEAWGSKVPLPYWEVWLYIAGWVGAVAYCFYSVYRASIDYVEELNDYFLVSGWRILGRRKDTSNFEWDFWSGWFLEVWPWLAGHLVLGLLCRRFFPQKRGLAFLLYTQLALYSLLGWAAVCMIWSHVIIAYLATFSRSKIVVWLTSLGLLITLNMDRTVKVLKVAVNHDPFEKKFYLLLFLLAMANIRYISAAVEIVQQKLEVSSLIEKNKKDASLSQPKIVTKIANDAMQQAELVKERPISVYTLFDVSVYVFYMPLMFTGPILTFDDFFKQFHCHHNAPIHAFQMTAIIAVIKRCLRLVFWILFIEFSLHYLYFNCLHLDAKLMNRLPLWVVAGTGYCHGQFFMVVYVVLFGLPSLLASADQIDTPAGPKCIARIHLYSDMWKYFDKGLYSFIKRYIYIPVGGSRHGLARQLLSSLLCFTFVYVWHGAMEHLFVWTLLNFIGISIEALASVISELPHIRSMEHRYISAATSRRLRALLSVPLLAMSAFAIFYFFGGQQVGYCYFRRLIIEGFPQSPFFLALFLYCCVQVSMETSLWEARKMHLE